MTKRYMAPETRRKIDDAAPKGTRHQIAKEIAYSLTGDGYSVNEIYAILRAKFEPDVTDKELWDVASWQGNNQAQPSKPSGGSNNTSTWRTIPPKKPVENKRSPEDQIAWWFGERTATVESVIAASQHAIPSESREMMRSFFELLYSETEPVNIVCQFKIPEDKPDKANPQGGGKTLSAKEWAAWSVEKGVPHREAGAWIRMNPCKAVGSGVDGAITDADITAFRYVLLESDSLPLETQLALYLKLQLPIALIVSSGGKSVHAWVKVEQPDYESYKKTSERIIKALEPFGFDKGNKNPSRLSRLPGATRKIGATGDGFQRLLYIKTSHPAFDAAALEAFEKSLTVPLIEKDRPLAPIFTAALTRYEELIANQGRLGVPTGIADFDRDAGGMKKKQMMVIAAETNGGKTSLAINMINGALQAGHGVALFTLEMDKDEILDLLVAMNCRVNRNSFNTGVFQSGETDRIVAYGSRMAALKLWIFDDATLTVEQIDAHLDQLGDLVDMFVVDYAQIVSPKDERAPREQQVAQIARDLKASAKRRQKPCIVLSQLNDEGKLRESRVLSHEAHIVAVLQTEENLMKMMIQKGRSIPRRTYELYYQPEYCKLASAARVAQEDVPKINSKPYPNSNPRRKEE